MRHPFFDPYTADFYQDSNEWNTQHLDTEQVGKIEGHDAHADSDPAPAATHAVAVEIAGQEADRIAALVRIEVRRVLAELQAAGSSTASSEASAEKSAPAVTDAASAEP